jgi:hypothetical protein
VEFVDVVTAKVERIVGLAARKRSGAPLLSILLLAAATACRHVSHDLYPNSTIIIDRRYSESRWEIAGTHADSTAAIARWYDTHFGPDALDGSTDSVVQYKRWRLTDRWVEVFIIDHGRNRSIYVRETWRHAGADLRPPARTKRGFGKRR